jgi:hypothetical protein
MNIFDDDAERERRLLINATATSPTLPDPEPAPLSRPDGGDTQQQNDTQLCQTY